MRIIIIFLLANIVSYTAEIKPIVLIGGSANLHSTSIEGLPGTPSTQNSFSPDLGIGFEFGAGFHWNFNKKLFGIFDSYSTGLLFKNYSAALSKRILAGNIIKEFEFSQAYYEFELNNNLTYIISTHSLNYKIYNINLSFGPDIGFTMAAKFDQVENLVADPGFVFEENGGTSINGDSGDINDLNLLYIGVNLGLSYSEIKFGNYSLEPYINYRRSFTSVINSDSWNLSSINLGTIIKFDFKKKIKPPKKPITPVELPLPEEPVYVQWEIIPSYKFNKLLSLNNSDLIPVNAQRTYYIDRYKLPPILYFEKNEIQPIESTVSSIFSKQIDLLDGIAKLGSNSDIEITYYSSDKAIIDKRSEFINNQLNQRGVGSNRINRIDSLISENKKYKELDEENERVEFKIENYDLIPLNFRTIERTSTNDEFEILIGVESNKQIKSSQINYLDNVYNQTLPTVISISSGQVLKYLDKEFNIDTKVFGEESDTSFIKKLKFKASYQTDTLINQVNETGNKESQFILGYFDFDSSDFKYLDNEVLGFIENALANNKKVKIYPLTDNLGSNDYNKVLSERRGNTASRVINNENIEIIYLDKAFFDNNHPFGRTLNRSVLVRIEN